MPQILFLFLLAIGCNSSLDGINQPHDAPKPLSPTEAVESFQLPAGFQIELVASEPLISEPTGVCWNEKGQLFISELHGYNLEGQLEIEDLNKAGVLDTVVRRVQAAEKYKKAAQTGTFGVIKILRDTDGDGVMDNADIFAENIPPAYGLCASRDGLIMAGQTEILYLADRNGDGKADVVDTLFSGFKGGVLERGVNAPQWGPDGWIYFGRGWNGGKITGPNLLEPVQLPGSNFRIRPDGSAIEPVTGSTHTIGHAFNADGYSFFTSTWKHALYAIPIPWQYLARNPDASIASLEADASDFSTVFPIAPVHPWKLARSSQPGWRELYDKYGLAESAAEGYFTSCCSPLIYQDSTFPLEYNGNLFVCEPAQSLIHRSIVEQDGTAIKVRRAEGEQKKEFLASTDSWFRPVSIAHGPDGSLYIVDMYREIIEDYSAVPRFMQQKYGLNNGASMGRIWRLSPLNAEPITAVKPVDLTNANLDEELDNPHYWRRQTADRLIWESKGVNAPELVKRRLKLAELHSNTPYRDFIYTLRAQDKSLQTDVAAARYLASLSSDILDERMLLQLALSLGYSDDVSVFNTVVELARKQADIRWMPDAIMTGVHGRAGTMLAALLKQPGTTGVAMLEPLAGSIAARQDGEELAAALKDIVLCKSPSNQATSLKGINGTIKAIPLTKSSTTNLNLLLKNEDIAVRGQAIILAGKLNLGDSKALVTIREQAAIDAANGKLSTQQRLAAVALLADSPDEFASKSLIGAWDNATPTVRSAILDALILRGNRQSALIDAMKNNVILANALSELQRTQLLERSDSHLRHLVELEFAKSGNSNTDKEAIFVRYELALKGKRDVVRGDELFRQMCRSCHKVNNIGTTVGPDLKLAYQNSDETLLRSILWPSEKISSSYESYTVTTTEDQKYTGVIVNESANSVMLRQAGGNELTFLRRDIKELTSSPSSLMPEYGQALSPQDCADIIAWVRVSLASK
ncbi:MAG: PVC-type heme-binding CxxCH protein [Cyclobacteriaceae bacterium]